MELNRVNESDKIIIYTLALILLIDLFIMVYAIINVNTVIYFFSELVFMTLLPAFAVYSVIIRLVNRYIPVKNLTTIILKLATILIYLCFIFIDKSYYINMYLDVPNIINTKYNTTIGKPSKVIIEGTKIRTQYFEINNVEFSVMTHIYRDYIKRDQNYKITYLQNSKYVISIEKD